MKTLLDKLSEKYRTERESINDSEMELLCMFSPAVCELESEHWKNLLQVNKCIYKGLHLTATVDSNEAALIVQDTLKEQGFSNTRIYRDPDAPLQLIVLGKKSAWLNMVSQKAEVLFEQIREKTGVEPVYVSWYSGITTVDVRNQEEAAIVAKYLQDEVQLNHQHMSIGSDNLLSLDIVQIKLFDTLTGHTFTA